MFAQDSARHASATFACSSSGYRDDGNEHEQTLDSWKFSCLINLAIMQIVPGPSAWNSRNNPERICKTHLHAKKQKCLGQFWTKGICLRAVKDTRHVRLVSIFDRLRHKASLNMPIRILKSRQIPSAMPVGFILTLAYRRFEHTGDEFPVDQDGSLVTGL
jgi:hypothetical protein